MGRRPKQPKEVDPEVLARTVAILTEVGYCSPLAAAPLLGLHWQTVNTYIKQGKIRSVTKGNRNYITQEEIERFNREGNYVPKPEDAERHAEDEPVALSEWDPQ